MVEVNVGILIVLLCFLFTYSSRFCGYGVGACPPCVAVVFVSFFLGILVHVLL